MEKEINMKCQYCGSNLGLENDVCPFCGRENPKAIKYVDNKKKYLNELDETKQKVKKQSKINARVGRLIFIVLMVAAIAVFYTIINQHADTEKRIANRQQKLEKTVEKNIDSIVLKVEELERNREYLGLSYYVLNYHLRTRNEFKDYSRVFTAADSYSQIFEDILNIETGFNSYGGMKKIDWCREIANAISHWNLYVEGEFWNDRPDSPMHTGEHGAFLSDIKPEVQDMVQVYFALDDEQADAMWTMDEESLTDLLYKQYKLMKKEASENE